MNLFKRHEMVLYLFMMRALIIFSILMTAVLTNADTSFDSLDIDKLISNEQQRKAVFGCLMDQKPCGEMQKLRDTLPDMIKTKCSQCTNKQKQKYDHISKVLLEKYPDNFNALVFKYSARVN